MREPITIRPDALALTPAESTPQPTTDAAGTPTLARSGVGMALGTVLSRGTGFLRTVVIASAIGEAGVANAYAVANTVPNALYDLLLGGILSAVIVPLLVQAAHDDPDGGEAYAQRLVTMVTVVLSGIAVLAVVLSPAIIAAYAHNAKPQQRALAVTFARYFLPQLLFYGIGATFGAILNVRGRFVAPMWAPVINNLVVIGSGIAFDVVTHTSPRPGHLSHNQTLILAIGTSAGVVAQTAALLPALRRAGFRLKARWDWRHAALRRAGPFAGWVLGYVITNQLGYLVIVLLRLHPVLAALRDRRRDGHYRAVPRDEPQCHGGGRAGRGTHAVPGAFGRGSGARPRHLVPCGARPADRGRGLPARRDHARQCEAYRSGPRRLRRGAGPLLGVPDAAAGVARGA
jgi:hypothetical protein